MAESEEHRNLVLCMSRELEKRYPQISIVADAQQNPGDPVPHLIGGFRPDVYASQPKNSPKIFIGEAKTAPDLDRLHTWNQLSAYLSHLESCGNGMLLLCVSGNRADLARTMLRFLAQDRQPKETAFVVLDGYDFWIMYPNIIGEWHLN